MSDHLRIVDRIESAERFEPILGVAPSGAKASQAAALPIEWFEDITPVLNGQWLIKQLIPSTGIAVMYGHPGSGKTFLALDMAFHVALGLDWFGKRVMQGCVIYVGAEGLAGLRNRITAFRKDRGIDGAPFALIPTPIDLQAPDADVTRLADAVRTACARYNARPALIVVDTLSKTFGGGKENTDDMASYVANCGRLAAEFDCCVMPVHHRPKDAESEEPRGHGSLKGGADTVILVEAGATKKIRVTKQKDAEIGAAILFNLRAVPLGQDEDGDEVTSCVVDPTTVDLTPARDPLAIAMAKLPDTAKIVLEALDQITSVTGIVPPSVIPDDMINRQRTGKVCEFGQWRNRALSGLRTDSDTHPDTPRRNFDRAVKRLQKDGIVRVWNDYAWRNRCSVPDTSRTPVGQGPDTRTPRTRVLEDPSGVRTAVREKGDQTVPQNDDRSFEELAWGDGE